MQYYILYLQQDNHGKEHIDPCPQWRDKTPITFWDKIDWDTRESLQPIDMTYENKRENQESREINSLPS